MHNSMVNEYLDAAMTLEAIINNIDNILTTAKFTSDIVYNLKYMRDQILNIRDYSIELAKITLPPAPDTLPPEAISSPLNTIPDIDKAFFND